MLSNFRQVAGILRVVRFPPQIIAEILLSDVKHHNLMLLYTLQHVLPAFPNKRNVIDRYVAGDADPF
jgi:hypothetical protein